MKVSIFLDAEEAQELEAFADEEHRTLRQQATVIILKALEARRQTLVQHETVAA